MGQWRKFLLLGGAVGFALAASVAAGSLLFKRIEIRAEYQAKQRLLAEARLRGQRADADRGPWRGMGSWQNDRPALRPVQADESSGSGAQALSATRLEGAQTPPGRAPQPSVPPVAREVDSPLTRGRAELAANKAPDAQARATASTPGDKRLAAEFNRIAPSSFVPAAALSDAEDPPESWEGSAQGVSPGAVAPAAAGYVAFGGAGEASAGEAQQAPAPEQAPAEGQPSPSGAGLPAPSGLSQPVLVPRITLVPSSATAELGQTVRVEVRIEGGYDVSSVPFHVQHDGKVLQFERVYAGDFLSRDGSAPVVMAAPLEGSNEVAVGITKTGIGPGISGSGTLLTLQFRVVAAGTTPLTFAQEQVLNSRRREVPAQFVSTQVSAR